MSEQQAKWVVVKGPEPFTAEWFLYNFLKDWTPDDLRLVIKKGVDIELGAFKDVIVEMAVREVLNWFKQYRPDLWEVLTTEEGLQWLRRQVERAIRS